MGHTRENAMPTPLTAEEESKDRFFRRVAEVAEAMVAAHGKDFAMGTLVLAARWIAENRRGQEAQRPAPEPAPLN